MGNGYFFFAFLLPPASFLSSAFEAQVVSTEPCQI